MLVQIVAGDFKQRVLGDAVFNASGAHLRAQLHILRHGNAAVIGKDRSLAFSKQLLQRGDLLLLGDGLRFLFHETNTPPSNWLQIAKGKS